MELFIFLCLAVGCTSIASAVGASIAAASLAKTCTCPDAWPARQLHSDGPRPSLVYQRLTEGACQKSRFICYRTPIFLRHGQPFRGCRLGGNCCAASLLSALPSRQQNTAMSPLHKLRLSSLYIPGTSGKLHRLACSTASSISISIANLITVLAAALTAFMRWHACAQRPCSFYNLILRKRAQCSTQS